MKLIFERMTDLKQLEGVPLADYKPTELCAYILKKYPGNPIRALECMCENMEIGNVLGEQTRVLLEGVVDVERN